MAKYAKTIASSSEPCYTTLRVELLSGPMDGAVYLINKETVTIGREDTNDVAIPLDTRLSRFHACVSRIESKLVLEDLGSTNGTFADGEKVESKKVVDATSEILTGQSTIRVSPVITDKV